MITVLGNRTLRTSDLKEYPVKRPERAGDRWKGVHHHDLAVELEEALWSRRIGITREIWTVDPSGQTLVGGFSVTFPDHTGLPSLNGLDYALGIRHSNDQKHALTFSAGAAVLVCLNGVVTGTWVLKRKHTTGLDLSETVGEGVDRFVEEARKVKQTVESLRVRYLPPRQVDHVLMEAGRLGIVPWSHVGKVYEEFQAPRHEEFKGRSAWCLYNAMGEIVKHQNPARQLDSLDRFRTVLLN